MRVNHNINAMIATNKMSQNTALAGKSMEKLSTGLRINRAGDDAAGLAISEKMRSQIRGMEQAERNVQDGVSLIQTAEGALKEAGDLAQRMRELAVQAGNDVNTSSDRAKIQQEITALSQEMEKIGSETKFNKKGILNGSNAALTIQAGANDSETRQVDMVNLVSIVKGGLDANQIKVTSGSDARCTIKNIDIALESINSGRTSLGAMQNRLEATASNLATSNENLTTAESRIRDVDVAKEMVKLSKLNIINQASQSMAAQAKQQPQGVMQLLQ